MAAGSAEFAATQFTPNGLPGIFVPYLLPEQTLPRAFMNEFVNVRHFEYYRESLPFLIEKKSVPSSPLSFGQHWTQQTTSSHR